MKITDCIPGKQLPLEEGNPIAEKMLSSLNPNNLSPIALWEELNVISLDRIVKVIEDCNTNEYYLLYIYYMNRVSYRVFCSTKKSVVDFIKENFNDNWGEGIDIIISDMNFEKIFMGNHDGIFVMRSE